MITRLANPKHAFRWTAFHVLLGFMCTFTPWALIGWFYSVLLSSAPGAFNRISKNSFSLFTCLIAYLLGFELLDRMAKTSPFIPYELGKYLLLAFIFIALIVKKKNSYGLGVLMILLISPAAFYDLSEQRLFYDLINNFFGPLALAMGVALWGNQQTTHT